MAKDVFIIILLFNLMLPIALASGRGLDKQGGHFNHKSNTYHCHKESCFSINKQFKVAFWQAVPAYSRAYNRKDWPYWVDYNSNCRNTREEFLLITSNRPVKFKSYKRCIVKYGHWYGVYGRKTFTKASDVYIDHIVPIKHAHRHGADKWTRAKRRAFANEYNNLLVIGNSFKQSKSDNAPHEWLPPNKSFWCEYGKRWTYIKNKYGLHYSGQERITLIQLAETCLE